MGIFVEQVDLLEEELVPFQLEVMGGIRLGARGRIRTRSGIGVRFAATHGGRTGLELTHHPFNLPINRCRLVMGLIQPGRVRPVFLRRARFFKEPNLKYSGAGQPISGIFSMG